MTSKIMFASGDTLLGMFTFGQLTAFVAVAEELSFVRAAERLHVSQPPLTRQIQALERSLGVQLLTRSSRSVRLTAPGQAFLRDARRLLRDVDGATLNIRRTFAGTAGSLQIGFTSVAAFTVLGVVVTSILKNFPGVDVSLQEFVTKDQLDELSGNNLDLGLARPPIARRQLESREIFRESLVVALPPGHPLTGRPGLRLADLNGADIVMYSPSDSQYFHELVVSLLRKRDVNVHHRLYVAQVHDMLSLVEAGLGVAIVPASAERVGHGGVVFRHLPEETDAPVRLHLVWREPSANPVVRAVLDLPWAINGLGED